MSNDYFQFKQFMVRQSGAAMKVGTDGCLLGAWAQVESCAHVLDIGTGTGLLSLMCAQRLSAFTTDFHIDAIDIDSQAVEQALENVNASPWKNHIHVCQADVLTYTALRKYDLIVCNPPYFVNSLLCPDKGRTLARHTYGLSFEGLLDKVLELLTEEGRFCVILPYQEGNAFVKLAEARLLYVNRRVDVHTTARKPAKRVLLEFAFHAPAALCVEKLVIHEGNEYSKAYSRLLESFYL